MFYTESPFNSLLSYSPHPISYKYRIQCKLCLLYTNRVLDTRCSTSLKHPFSVMRTVGFKLPHHTCVAGLVSQRHLLPARLKLWDVLSTLNVKTASNIHWFLVVAWLDCCLHHHSCRRRRRSSATASSRSSTNWSASTASQRFSSAWRRCSVWPPPSQSLAGGPATSCCWRRCPGTVCLWILRISAKVGWDTWVVAWCYLKK